MLHGMKAMRGELIVHEAVTMSSPLMPASPTSDSKPRLGCLFSHTRCCNPTQLLALRCPFPPFPFSPLPGSRPMCGLHHTYCCTPSPSPPSPIPVRLSALPYLLAPHPMLHPHPLHSLPCPSVSLCPLSPNPRPRVVTPCATRSAAQTPPPLTALYLSPLFPPSPCPSYLIPGQKCCPLHHTRCCDPHPTPLLPCIFPPPLPPASIPLTWFHARGGCPLRHTLCCLGLKCSRTMCNNSANGRAHTWLMK